MLCRYDTYALKCQDVFSVHGFPVGLVAVREQPPRHPRRRLGRLLALRREVPPRQGLLPPALREPRPRERAVAVWRSSARRSPPALVDHYPSGEGREAWLSAAPATDIEIPPESLDGVFTDPPYFANVQYAELMDFCYVWLRQGLEGDLTEFGPQTTRSAQELTGNITMGRDLAHFAEGLSRIYRHYAAALKTGAPFVFTYHHNELAAYAPLVVAVLDAGMDCTAVQPAPAEMGASLHINGTASSILDSVFVCRGTGEMAAPETLRRGIAGAAAE